MKRKTTAKKGIPYRTRIPETKTGKGGGVVGRDVPVDHVRNGCRWYRG